MMTKIPLRQILTVLAIVVMAGMLFLGWNVYKRARVFSAASDYLEMAHRTSKIIVVASEALKKYEEAGGDLSAPVPEVMAGMAKYYYNPVPRADGFGELNPAGTIFDSFGNDLVMARNGELVFFYSKGPDGKDDNRKRDDISPYD